MHSICVAIWETGEWPEDWTFATFIPLFSANYRSIALVSHASKILLRITLERIRVRTEREIAEEQTGFRQERGTRDQITNLRILTCKASEHQQPLCMCFLDSIFHDKLWVTMMNMRYPLHLIDLLAKLHRKQFTIRSK